MGDARHVIDQVFDRLTLEVIEKLQAENAALTSRVAELEAFVREIEGNWTGESELSWSEWALKARTLCPTPPEGADHD